MTAALEPVNATRESAAPFLGPSVPDEAAGVAVPRLELRHLVKTLGASRIVDGLDLAIAPGEVVVLLGPSGCGKTTTLRMVAGFLQPDEGEVHLAGRLAASARFALPPEKRHLGMMFQNYAVWPHKTVFQNVAYGLQVAGIARDEIRRRVERMLAIVDLDGHAGRKPADLSGGQQQRVALARALVTEPSLLLLDEPLSNLDAALRQSMRVELKALQRRVGVSMLYVTHDQDEALVLADRIVVMRGGRIEQIGTPEDIYRRPRTRFVAEFIGRANLLPGTLEALDGQGRARVRLDAGPVFRALGGPGLAAGQRCQVVVRPEQILFAPGGAEARLCQTLFLGSHYELTLELGESRLQAEARHLPAMQDGRLSVAIEDDSAWVLP
ncbi:ABC transporter ATP-binding protein [Azotobacter vinelandii]|uniref:ABC transporter ATP-binding protein n=1 Tax=Azotobacter TaxID=352 RepID=UPI0000527003|nr:ABC transporter ATP-binding protein [Azotobacter vinelandii]GLK61238.1 polyamine-transporting ATPase [Azotobacter vinelandii]SFY08644.1 iron(III) transport system ATP-binding protein [Azotobacter vinelandii]